MVELPKLVIGLSVVGLVLIGRTKIIIMVMVIVFAKVYFIVFLSVEGLCSLGLSYFFLLNILVLFL